MKSSSSARSDRSAPDVTRVPPRRTLPRAAALVLVLLALSAMPTLLLAQSFATEASVELLGTVSNLPPSGEGGALPLPFLAPPSDEQSAEIQRQAEAATGRRLVVSLPERMVWLMIGSEVVYAARAGVGKSVILEYEDQRWDFRTPKGRRVIISKQRNPVWTPPEWHYVEMAARHGLQLQQLRRGQPVDLEDGSRVLIRGSQVGRLDPDGRFHPVSVGDEIVFDGTIFVPPFDTVNRRIPGELGRFKLDFGDSYYFHGTPYDNSIGGATTHGCIRLLDADLEYLYDHVPVGTPVYIY